MATDDAKMDVGGETAALRERLARVLYDHNHADWSSALPSAEHARQDAFRRADAVLADLEQVGWCKPLAGGVCADGMAHWRLHEHDFGVEAGEHIHAWHAECEPVYRLTHFGSTPEIESPAADVVASPPLNEGGAFDA